MTNTTKLFDLSELAEAAYADFTGFNDSFDAGQIVTKLTTGNSTFSATQATEFAKHWRVISHQPDTASGFSATLFQRIDTDPVSGYQANQYVYAIRGTAGLLDLTADFADIAVDGLAMDQIVDMYNHWRWLTTPTGQSYQVATLVDLVNGSPDKVLVDSPNYYKTIEFKTSSIVYPANDQKAVGLGRLSASETVSITGHSLGGHLAASFTRLFGGSATTINGAGFGYQAPTNIENLFRMLGGSPAFNANNISNIYGDKNPNIITQNGFSLYQQGSHDALFIEQSSFLDNTLGHGSSQMTDSLAVANLFIRLDPSFASKTTAQALRQLNALLEKASNTKANSLEDLVEGLTRVLTGNQINIATDDRDSLYTAIKNLQALDATGQPTGIYKSLTGNVSLTNAPTSAAEARADFGAFLSLINLSPFAIKATTPEATAALQAANASLSAQWQADNALNAEQRANGEANYSDLYLADRAAMLSWQTKFNTLDIDSTAANPYINTGADQHFKDSATNTDIYINGIVSESRNFLFGSDIGPINADTLTGGNKEDHLYGLSGADNLNGGGGNDWLEGGADADKLNGGVGTDTLYGGTGGDELTGGIDLDYLYGGAGMDTYLHNTGDGNDVIIDSDGQGRIKVNGASPLQGGTLKATNLWESDDKQTRYTLFNSADGSKTLNILLQNGERIFVRNWQDGQLGIHLPTSEQPTPPNPAGVTGDDDYLEVAIGAARDGLSGNDVLVGNSGKEALYGGLANDILFGNDNDDTLDGGAGNDYLNGGAGKDTISGGAGDDIIHSSINLNGVVIQKKDANGNWQSATSNDANWKLLAGSWQWQYYGESAIPGGRFVYLDNTDNLEILTKWTTDDPDFGFSFSPNNDISAGDVIYAGEGNDVVYGSDGGDYISGDAGEDAMLGLDGDDVIYGGDGKDEISGGDGNDYIDGGNQADVIYGAYGDDYIAGGDGNDSLSGDLPIVRGTEAPPQATDFARMGNDVLDGGAGNDLIKGGAGNDTLFGGADDDELQGDGDGTPESNQGNDLLDGGAGNDKLFGQGGNDSLFGGIGNDTLNGDGDSAHPFQGDDFLSGGEGSDLLYGGKGSDTLDGGDGSDSLYGEDGNDNLSGGGGSDYLAGGEGNDTVDGGAGDDGLYGNAGNDTLISDSGNDRLDGGDGDDIYYINGNGLTLIDDKKGINTVYATGVSSADQLTIRYGTAADGTAGYVFGAVTDDSNMIVGGVQVLGAVDEDNANTLFQFSDGTSASFSDLLGINETESQLIGLSNDTSLASRFVNAGKGNDILVGGTQVNTQDILNGWDGDDTIYAQNGNDVLNGGGGNDVLYGDDGSDTLKGGSGNDAMDGGSGIDTYLVNLGDGADYIVEHSDSISHITFGAGISASNVYITYADPDYPDPSRGFTLHYSATDSVEFKTGLIDGLKADFTFSDSGTTVATIEELLVQSVKTAQVLTGDSTNNILMGGTLNDSLSGLSGNDALISGLGSDTLVGGLGNDTLIGGAGSDSYLFNLGDGQDLIIDTNQANNVITFGAGISLDSLTTRNVTDADGKNYLVINYGMQGDSITIQDGANNAVGSFKFTDGNVTYSLSQIPAFSYNLVGTAAAETLTGGRSNDTLKGNAGADTLMGGLGDDTYIVKIGDGSDTIIETGNGSLTGKNLLNFGDININQVTGTKRIDADGKEYLVLQYGNNPSDSVSILNGFKGSVETFSLIKTETYNYGWGDYSYDTNVTISWQELINATVITAMAVNGTELSDKLVGGKVADTLNGLAGEDTLNGGAGDDILNGGGDNDTIYGAEGDDVLDGSTGTDVLSGEAGVDTYLFKRGDGRDVIIESGTEANRILLGANIALSDVQVLRDANDMILSIAGSDDSLTLRDYFSHQSPWDISFADNVSQTTIESLWDIESNRIASLAVEDRVQTYKNDFLNRIKSSEEKALNQVYQYDSPVNTFQVQTITQESDAATIFGTAVNTFSATTEQTGVRTYTVYDHAPATAPQVSYRFVSFDTARLLYLRPNGILDLPQGSQRVTTTTPPDGETSGGSNTNYLLGYNIPVYSGITYSAYALTSYTQTVPVYTTFNNRNMVVEFINGGDSDNQIYETSTEYANSFDGVRLYFKDGYTTDYYPSYYKTAWLDPAHQLVDGGGGDDMLSGGGWSLDANAYQSFIEQLSNGFANMNNRPGSFFYGGDGDDSIIGTALADELIGGFGNDTLNGAAGADVYRILAGSSQGWDTIDDSGYARVLPEELVIWQNSNLYGLDETYGGAIPTDTVVFEAGIRRQDLTVSWGSLAGDNKLSLDISWNSSSGLHVMVTPDMPKYGPLNDVNMLYKGALGVESFQFADGTSMTMDEMQALAPPKPSRVLTFKLGDGVVTPEIQWNSTNWLNQISFDSSITISDIKVTRDGADLLLTHVNATDQIRLENWYSSLGTTLNLKATFTDGYELSASYLSYRGLTVQAGDGNDVMNSLDGFANYLSGGAGNDTLIGGTGNDGLTGGDGNDSISGNGGNDYLYGSAGDDYLNGGAGNDYYGFNAGDGHDFVQDGGSSGQDFDTLYISIDSTSASLVRQQNDLVIVYGNDSVSIAGWYLANGKTIEEVQFNNGVIWTNQYLIDHAPADAGSANTAPAVGNPIADLIATEDTPFNFTLPLSAFSDADAGDALSYTSTLADGSPLPSWLTFNVATQTYTGTPANSHVGALAIKLTATDVAGASVSQTFGLSVQNVNDAPNVIGSVANQQAIDGNHYSFTLPDGLFEDIDVGDVLSYSFTMADGSALPAWLNFDSQTKMLSGTPGASVIGNLSLKVTATDLAGVSAFITFGLAVNAMPDQSVIGTSANESLITGSGNDTLDGAAGVDTLSGGYGNDLYLVDNAADVVTEAAGQGNDTVQSSVSYTLAGNVENLTLTGTTAINATGNSLNNVLTGNSGNNTLNGLVGADTLIGALGNDLYIVDNVADMVTESVSEGTDTVQSSVTYTLSANVENLTLTGASLINATGNELSNTLTGNAAANILTGGFGNDTINGVGGVDTMIGGLGNDTYTIDWLTDVITENEDEGTDTVNVSINNANGTYSLTNNLENAYISSSVAYNLTGNALNNALTGNSAANALTGGDGNDTLKGGSGADTLNGGAGIDTISYSETWTGIQINLGVGTATGGDATGDVLIGIENIIGSGANDTLIGDSGNNYLDGSMGADSLSGGLGNDKYVLDNASDVVTENANEGIDTVVALNIHYTLGANVENLILQGGNGSNGTGNSLNNEITGNQLNNVLNGGAGADTMSGGLSYDTYIVDDIGDIVIENVNEGTDAVQASVTYTLSDNVENLTLTGTANLNGFGNASNNNITGNSGNNQLSGGLGNDNLDGNAGNDTMLGGLGNDIYVVDSAADVVVESGNEGIDTVRASIAYTLGANVENLTLSDSSWYGGGNGLDNVLIGGTPYNRLEGFDGNDTLDGGFGVDTMIGGAGNDTYIVDNASDVVTENSSEGNDTVRSLISYTLNTNVENLTLLGAANINGIGNALSNFLSGNSAINTLSDATGNDLLQGMAGADVLNDTSGNNLLDGGLDNDAITGGSGNDIIIGGLGNDTITTGSGYDVISFNKGDGQDIVNVSTGADNTLSLGGSFAYSDLSLSKTGNDLLLKVGATDQITLKDWYAPTANKSVINLQVIAEAVSGFSLGSSDALRNNKIENFNFANLVAAYDTAGNPASWALTDAILTAHLKTGSDSAAIGGDLAYQYGVNGNLTGIGLLAAQGVMNAATVGQSAQMLNSPTTWQAEAVKLG